MSDDPVRWKDAEDAPAKVRGLLAHGRAVPPMPADVRAALLSQLPLPPSSPPPAPPAAGGAPGAASLGVPSAWIIGGVAVVAVAVSALVWSARSPEPPVVPATEAPRVVAPPSAPTATEAASALPSPLPSTTPAPVRPSAAPLATSAASPAASAPRESNLAEESALINRARTDLATRPAQTLATIDEHARRFPRGELAAEREYLRVSALRRLGRNDEARTRGQRYLTLFPTSPYASSVRTILSEIGEP